MNDPRPNLVFIAGCDRSGSTLLSRLLGQVPSFAALGELRGVWLRGMQNDQLCGCGVPFSRCDFWSEVVRQGFGNRAAVPLENLLRLRWTVDRMRRIHLLLRKRPPARFARALSEYRGILATLLDAVRRVSGAEVLVDSTKGPSSALVLAGVPGARVHVVHLVRDSRAVARSFARRKVNPGVHWETSYMLRKGTAAASVYWMSTNLLSHAVRGRASGFTFLRYEDFAAHPAETVEALVRRLGREGRPTEQVVGGAASFAVQHTVAGNPMRFQTGRTEIKADLEWKTALPLAAKVMTTALTWPLLLRYGYLGRGARAAAGDGLTAGAGRAS